MSLRTLLLLAIALYATMACYFALAGPRVPVAGGLGWDGVTYAAMVGELPENARFVTAYSLRRFLPSEAAGHVLVALGIEKPQATQIVMVYACMNLALMLGMAAFWLGTARAAGFGTGTTFLGFVGLMFAYAQVREPFFLPVGTDYFAIFLSTAGLYFYVTRRLIGLLAISLGAIATWPTALPVSLAMLAMGVRAASPDDQPERGAPRVAVLEASFRWAFVPTYLALSIYFVYVAPMSLPSGAVDIAYPIAPLSMLIAVAYVAWAAYSLRLLPLVRPGNFDATGIAAVTFLLGAHVALGLWAESAGINGSPVTTATLAWLVATEPVVRPAQFFAAHFAYWGPAMFLVVAALPRMSFFARRYPGVLASLVLFTVFFLFSESRWLAYFLPPVLFCACGALQREADALSASRGAVLLGFCLAASHFWMPMGASAYGPDFSQFPAQYLFMHMGPWMSDMGYIAGLIQMGLSVLVLQWALRLRFGANARA